MTGGAGTLGGVALTNAAGRDIFLAKFTPDGKVAWLSEGHGSTNAMIHELTCDRAGNVWAAGMFKGALKLADRTVTSHGDSDLLLTHFDAHRRRPAGGLRSGCRHGRRGQFLPHRRVHRHGGDCWLTAHQQRQHGDLRGEV
jgi:hypothetical protein